MIKEIISTKYYEEGDGKPIPFVKYRNKNMKTIKELEALKIRNKYLNADSGYHQALKDVLGLIDELSPNNRDDLINIKTLKARISG